MCKGPEVGLCLVLLQNTWLECCEREGVSRRRNACEMNAQKLIMSGQVFTLESSESLLVSLCRRAPHFYRP